jgi:predicted amidohydrolase YtcJ
VRTKVAERVARAAPGDWINGRGWDEGKLEERRYIRATDLDAVSPNNPVRLTHTTGHYVAVNSAALKLANITKDTPDPPGGTIDRYPDGTPTGVLKEGAAGLVRSRGGRGSGLPADATEQGIRELAKAFNAEGMTGAKDPGISRETWDVYKKVLADGGLTVRIFALWLGGSSPSRAKDLIAQVGSFTKPYESTGDDHLVSGGIKLYIDGSGGARTAWLYDDWNKESTGIDAGNKGYPTSSPDSIRALIRIFHDAGLHIAVHSSATTASTGWWTVTPRRRRPTPSPGCGMQSSMRTFRRTTRSR